MSYIAIRRDALDEIVADRLLQSTDFTQGDTLAKAIQLKADGDVGPRLGLKSCSDGLMIYGSRPTEDKWLVIDREQAGSFDVTANSSHVLLFVQKTARFALKYWQSGVLKPSEIVNREGTRGIVFPFPISQQTSIRIVMDLAPDAARTAKRGRAGRYLLLFKVSDDASGAGAEPSLATFRRFLDDVEREAPTLTLQPLGQGAGISIEAMSSTSLELPPTVVDPHQAYETWMHLLTKDQARFVTAPLTSPRRVDGPAGSGKTISLALSALHAMRRAAAEGREYDTLFVTHSEASRKSIQTILESMGAGEYITSQASVRRLQVFTLQGYCAALLRQDLSATEFVDQDAFDAKQLQMMYVEEALRSVESELPTYERFMSDDFKSFLAGEDASLKIAMIQHEIAVVIKGRSKESLDIYKKVPSISAGLPVRSSSDKGFLWRIYEKYREQLVLGGQFDTDDVVLTALSQLSTPIWRRRRARDGFDAIFIDETHLFNMNELSVFHHLCKSDTSFPIAFAVDRSQAIGDRGWSDDIDMEYLVPGASSIQTQKVDLRSIFRSSPDIVNFAFTITSSGASLFTNFEDPLLRAHSNMSFEEEKKAIPPFYSQFANDREMIEGAFAVAEKMRVEMSSSKGDIALIFSNEELFSSVKRLAGETNKPVEVLDRRGDEELARRARSTGRFVISMPEYVGGLEFDGVVLVGIDEGRVPAKFSNDRAESRAYVTYAAHNRLYVAISRARYRVAVLGTSERGPSPILSPAFASGALENVLGKA